MLVPRVQSTNYARPFVKKAASKASETARKLSEIRFESPKVAFTEPDKFNARRSFSEGGSTYCDESCFMTSYPDLYNC